MNSITLRNSAILLVLIAGCTSTKPRQPEPSPIPKEARGTSAAPKPLAINDRAISPARQRDPIEDRELLIPPPPSLAEMKRPTPGAEAPEATIIQASNTESVVNPPARVEKDEALATMKRIHQAAAAAYAKIDAFEARLTRRETINGKPNPQEVIRFQFRQQPYSVHLKWIGGDPDAFGREVIYVQGMYQNKMHIKPSKGDSPFPVRVSFAPDDSTVRSKSRHDIREAGMAQAVNHMGAVLKAIDQNPSNRPRLKYLGGIQRAEYASKMEAIEETIPPKIEQLFPQGAKRTYFFDTTVGAPSTGLPVLVVAFDHTGREVEYYCFDRFLFPVRFNDGDFDPDKVWSKK